MLKAKKREEKDRHRIVGQERVLKYLASTIERDRLSSAYLFHGPNAVGKRSTAQLFLQAVLCLQPKGLTPCGTCISCTLFEKEAHPDAVFVHESPETRTLGVDDIRELQRKLNFRPTIGSYRVALIGNADALTVEAANSLLKTLEEPPEKTVLVLCATILSTLPLTLRSRCQQLAFQLVKQPHIYELLRRYTDQNDHALNLSHLALGRPGIALALLEQPDEFASYQERVLQLLGLLKAPLAKRFLLVQELLPSSVSVSTARQELLPIFDLWTWLLRDAMLLKERNEEFLVHRYLLDELRALGESTTTQHLLESIRMISRGKQQLSQNVNPHLALEQCLIEL